MVLRYLKDIKPHIYLEDCHFSLTSNTHQKTKSENDYGRKITELVKKYKMQHC